MNELENKIQENMALELISQGWTPITFILWRSPRGFYYEGPEAAYRSFRQWEVAVGAV